MTDSSIDAPRREFSAHMREVLTMSICGHRVWRRGGTLDSTRLNDPHVAILDQGHAKSSKALRLGAH